MIQLTDHNLSNLERLSKFVIISDQDKSINKICDLLTLFENNYQLKVSVSAMTPDEKLNEPSTDLILISLLNLQNNEDIPGKFKSLLAGQIPIIFVSDEQRPFGDCHALINAGAEACISLSDDHERNYLTVLSALNSKKKWQEYYDRSQQWKTIFETSNLGMMEVDSDGKIIAINSQINYLFEPIEIDLLGKSVFDITDEFVFQQYVPEVKAHLDAALAGKETKPFEVCALKKVFDVLLLSTPKVPYIYVILRDITEKSNIRKALEDSTHFTDAIIQASPIGISIRDRNGTLIKANKAWQRLWGKSVKDIRKASIPRETLKFDGKDDYLGEHLEPVKRIYEDGGEYSIPELRLKQPAPGKARWVSQHFKALKDHAGNVEKVIILTTDITAYKEAEMSLTRQTSQLEKLLSAAGQLTESIDLNRVLNQIAKTAMDIIGGSSNTILIVDEKSHTLKPVVAIDPEYSAEILASPAPINGSYTGKVIKAKRGMIFNDMSDGEGFHIVETPEDLDQRIIAVPLMEDNQAIGGMCLSRHGEYFTKDDLILANTFAAYASTALKNARVHYDLKQEMEERVRAERELLLLRKAVEASAEAIFLTDAEGIFTYVNSGFTKTYGWQPEEVVGIYTPRILKSGKLSPKNYKQFWDKILKGEIVKGELVNKAKDDSLKYVDSSVNPVLNNNKEIDGFLAIQKDITEQVEAAQREEKIQDQLRQSQRLESIGRLAGGVAHEINNPLMGIINYADLIQESIADETLKEYAQGIMEEGDRMAKIVRNLLSFARREEDEYSPALIQDIIENSFVLISSVFRKDQLTVIKDYNEDLPKIKCRSHQIQQVFVNLLSNARYALNLKYPGFHENKIIKVSAKLIEIKDSDWVRTTIEDHGPGIAEDIIDKIFEPFFTTKSRSIGSEEKGTGLGLAISYGIIDDHKGKITVESEPGEFTRFHVDLQVDNNW